MQLGHRPERVPGAKRGRTVATAIAAALAWAAAAAGPPAPPLAPDSVENVVAGIIGYTRWPSEPTPLRLCTVGRGPGVDALRDGLAGAGALRPVEVRPLGAGQPASGACEAVYIGTLPPAQLRKLLLELAGQPVLTLGEGVHFCSDGGMFCLEGGVRFAVNLDAIGRSSLRVNPMVLRLARGNGGGS